MLALRSPVLPPCPALLPCAPLAFVVHTAGHAGQHHNDPPPLTPSVHHLRARSPQNPLPWSPPPAPPPVLLQHPWYAHHNYPPPLTPSAHHLRLHSPPNPLALRSSPVLLQHPWYTLHDLSPGAHHLRCTHPKIMGPTLLPHPPYMPPTDHTHDPHVLEKHPLRVCSAVHG
ncbi:hypothetical protein C8R45DRAFT_943850 [Mycena sanguinolenta]|nr:hypothetical protein C8R45DRAFT_943850 [Mycena sanguinolenta]